MEASLVSGLVSRSEALITLGDYKNYLKSKTVMETGVNE